MLKPGVNELALIGRLKEGDSHAFDLLFGFYSKKVYAFSYGYLKCKEDAEEIVQETFVRVWENRHKIDPALSFSAYLFTIAHRLILNAIRKKKNERKSLTEVSYKVERAHNRVESELQWKDLEQWSRVAMSAMPARRKEIFLLNREHHLSYDEIAAALNISKKTVEAQITQALKDLRKYFGLNKTSVVIAILAYSLALWKFA